MDCVVVTLMCLALLWYHKMLLYIRFFHAVFCPFMLCLAVLWQNAFTILCCVKRCTVWRCLVEYCILQCCVAVSCLVLWHAVLYSALLWHAILFSALLWHEVYLLFLTIQQSQLNELRLLDPIAPVAFN